MNAALNYKNLSLVSPDKENGQIVARPSLVKRCELRPIYLNISSFLWISGLASLNYHFLVNIYCYELQFNNLQPEIISKARLDFSNNHTADPGTT